MTEKLFPPSGANAAPTASFNLATASAPSACKGLAILVSKSPLGANKGHSGRHMMASAVFHPSIATGHGLKDDWNKACQCLASSALSSDFPHISDDNSNKLVIERKLMIESMSFLSPNKQLHS